LQNEFDVMHVLRTTVVVDSTASLSRDQVEGLPLTIVPLQIALNGQSYQDGIDLTPDEFYRRIATSESTAQTSAPSPSSFQAAFAEAAATGTDVLCITVSSLLSATYDAARAAIELAQTTSPHQQIHLLDSGTAGGAEALVALAAARAAQEGKSLEEVEAVATWVAGRVYFVGVLETLKHLQRGGRVPRVASWAASLLNIKPVLAIWPGEGEVRMLERPRSKPKAIERVLNVIERESLGKPLHVIVMHAAAAEEASALLSRIQERFTCVETLTTTFTPVIGAHTGPGLLGVAFYAEE
jgi:DegV family protein with EDD domain